MGLSSKDIRIFFSNRAKCWIIANDYKLRRMLDGGCSMQKAKDGSHGHIHTKEQAEAIKENILANKKTKSRDLYILKCYIRVTDGTYRHFNWLCGLYNSKCSKDKKYYYNANRGGAR